MATTPAVPPTAAAASSLCGLLEGANVGEEEGTVEGANVGEEEGTVEGVAVGI